MQPGRRTPHNEGKIDECEHSRCDGAVAHARSHNGATLRPSFEGNGEEQKRYTKPRTLFDRTRHSECDGSDPASQSPSRGSDETIPLPERKNKKG